MAKPGNQKETPLMAQYYKVKSKHPDAILLFRVGDFYEMFGEDAVKASGILGIVLTNRNNGGSDVPLAGFPFHALDMYLPRLVRGGYRVAICEQLEKPDPQKKIVRRGVTEIITPGVTLEESLLDTRKNNFLASIHFVRKDEIGVAFLDISTGEFFVSEGDAANADKLLRALSPSEILLGKDKKVFAENEWGGAFCLTWLEEWILTHDHCREKLLLLFDVVNLKGFGVDDMPLAQVAAGAVIHYLESTENRNLQHINAIARIQPEHHLWLDRFTIKNLELLQSSQESGTCLIDVLDTTVTPMGARLLKKWVVLPLRNATVIGHRLDIVGWFYDHIEEMEDTASILAKLGDLERLISRVPVGKVNPRDLYQLRRSMALIHPLKSLLLSSRKDALMALASDLDPCDGLSNLIRARLVDDPPVNLQKGGVIASGFSEELDRWRHIIRHSKDLLLDLQQRESENSGIPNLKIGYNSVFGYYLEVTNKYKALAPTNWIRKQTISQGERYVTEELKILETDMLQAEEKVLACENRLFTELVEAVQLQMAPVQTNARIAAQVDCLLGFARNARKGQYCRPVLDDSMIIDIQQGRHPVIEHRLPLGEGYVPNDILLNPDDQQVLMITGPNMSGKSAILRQTALICLMAQMGSFVPALSARIGLLDKIFTRVGASDNISSGESTFMVEMTETASILNNISSRSLVLLDEIGRGTSTYDGVSIAWAIAEYLHENPYSRPKVLFATHYHELNALADRFPRIHNRHVTIRELDNKIVFLRKLADGGSEHSFGIHVARMAGMPRKILERAAAILEELESHRLEGDKASGPVRPSLAKMPEAVQLSLFNTADPVAAKVKDVVANLDLHTMTPIDCMLKFRELKNLIDS